MNHRAAYAIAYTIAAVKKETKDPHKRPPMRKIIIVAFHGSTGGSLAYITAFMTHTLLVFYRSRAW